MKPRHRTLALALPLFLTSCAGSGDNGSISAPGVLGNGGPTVPPMEAATMSDPSDFLDQLACDGPGDFLHCVGAKHRQTPGEVAKYRRHDLPAPAGYQIGDCVAGSCIFSYPPFGPFAVAKGDGGDHYQVDGGWVRIDLTQDGGKPGVLQHFVGPTCGGDGWVLFRQDAPTGHWTEMDARLANTDDGHCPSRLGHAYTRWRLEDVQWTFYFGTTREQTNLTDGSVGALQPKLDSRGYSSGAILLRKGSRTCPMERLEQDRHAHRYGALPDGPLRRGAGRKWLGSGRLPDLDGDRTSGGRDLDSVAFWVASLVNAHLRFGRRLRPLHGRIVQALRWQRVIPLTSFALTS